MLTLILLLTTLGTWNPTPIPGSMSAFGSWAFTDLGGSAMFYDDDEEELYWLELIHDPVAGPTMWADVNNNGEIDEGDFYINFWDSKLPFDGNADSATKTPIGADGQPDVSGQERQDRTL